MALISIIGFCLWIWLELTVFAEIGGEIGVFLTLIGIFVTGAVGIWLLRTQGRAVMAALQKQVARGEAPLASVADSLSLLMGAVLMLIPGYVSDMLGLIMFVPGIRTIVGAILLKRFSASKRFGFAGTMAGGMPGGMSGGMNSGFGSASGFHSRNNHQGFSAAQNDSKSDTIEGEFEDLGENPDVDPAGRISKSSHRRSDQSDSNS